MDELEERLRRGLQHPSLSGDAERILADVHRGARARRQRRVALVAAGVLAVLTATGVLASPATRPDGNPPVTSPSSPAPSPTTAPTATATPDEAPPALRLTGATGFDATADGAVWSVSADTCGGTPCALLRKDLPDGHSEKVHVFTWDAGGGSDVPPVDSVTVSADGRDMWVWGPQLWSSHDGGKTWVPADLPGRRSEIPLQLTTVDGRVFAWQGDLAHVWTAPVGSDVWADFPVPTQVTRVEDVTSLGGRLVLSTYVADRRKLVLMDSSGSHWREVEAPCQGEVPPIRSTGSVLVAVCPGDGSFGDAPAIIMESTDGETWAPFAGVRHSSYVDAVIPVDADTVFVVTGEGGLLVTAGGQEPVDLTLGQDESVISGEFVTPEHGYLLVAAPSRILSTTDGGRTWSH